MSSAAIRLVSVGVLIALNAASSHAALPAAEKACALLADFNLATRGWKDVGGGMRSCSSPYQEIGTGDPMPNNLAYYVRGDAAGPKLIKLVVNVNNRAQAGAALKELSAAARLLTSRLTGQALPSAVNSSILKGAKNSVVLNGVKVNVVRDNWANGNGYEVQVVYE
jgi:hypothetical protein